MNTFISILIVALIIAVFPACIVGLACWLLWNIFWVPTLLIGASIWIIGSFWNRYLLYRSEIDHNSLQRERLKRHESESVPVSCAYCRTDHIIPIKVSERNEFKCQKCNQSNVIVFQFTAAQITTPLVVSGDSMPIEVK